jgi:hypothetical protein
MPDFEDRDGDAVEPSPPPAAGGLIRVGAGAIAPGAVRAIVARPDGTVEVYFEPAEKVVFHGPEAEALRRIVARLPERPGP